MSTAATRDRNALARDSARPAARSERDRPAMSQETIAMTREKCRRATRSSGYKSAKVAAGSADGSSPAAGDVYEENVGDA